MVMKLRHTWRQKLSENDNDTVGEIKRFELDDGRKVDIPFYKPEGGGFAKGIPANFAKPYPLFGLDTLLDLDQDVFVPEGQKCQAAFAGLGLQSVTSILGAKNASSSDWSRLHFAKSIVLMPDNDLAGEEYMQSVYQILSLLEVTKITVARLPCLPQKGDVCDWLKQQPELANWDELTSLEQHSDCKTLGQRLLGTIASVQLEVPDSWRHAKDVGADDWSDPEPINSELLPVPQLPDELIPEPLSLWVKDIAYRMQVPSSFAAAGALVIAGALIGTACGIRPKLLDDWLVIPNLWGGIVARPGKLKSPMIAALLKPVARLEAAAAEEFEQQQADYLIELAEFESREKALHELMRKAAKQQEEGVN